MKRRSFSAEFNPESAQLVVIQNYIVTEAVSAIEVGLCATTRRVKQPRNERQIKMPKASFITRNKLKYAS